MPVLIEILVNSCSVFHAVDTKYAFQMLWGARKYP